MKIIFVTDNKDIWKEILSDYDIVYPTEYLQDMKYTSPDFRVINLSNDYSYQSSGYYVSLLAQARGHKVTPSIMTIQDAKDASMIARLHEDIGDEIQKDLKNHKLDSFVLSVYFGQNMAEKYSRLCRKLYAEFPHPMFRVSFERKKTWVIKKIQVLTIADVMPSHYDFIVEAIKGHCGKRYYRKAAAKKYYYDIAILHDPEDECPPSNKEALQKFIQAGDQLGLNVELITKDDYRIINEYDGLFIRETTAVNHHTYRFARKAAAEKLLVIDDPESILKCTNKVYMAEYLKVHHIHGPETMILSRHNYKKHVQDAKFPCVLKRPDGAFSIGVKKVESKEEFLEVARDYFAHSDLLIVQEFMPSEYDWRVGIIDNEVFYGCRYYMAKGHWQILNWADESEREGEFDTLRVADIPEFVKKTALKATKGIGNGLYGVDLKVVNNKAYVIEINDNPSIDAGVEDKVKENNVYQTIMKHFLTQLNKMHGHDK